ncbi:hypothetical protein [Streptomyces sp. NPDC059894]|uniref:hypothetical protein n=1 Tax=unclassified Streptomyces TaxID=2593676 RepID=UPI00364793A5
MGVLARLFRRSKTTEGTAATEETAAAKETVTEEATAREAETTAEASAGTPVDGAEAAPTAGDAPGRDSGGAGDAEETVSSADTDPATDGVEIPRQQSSEETVDSEAGEGARR